MTTSTDTANRLVIRRMLPAPQDRVYRAWTDREESMKWSAPEGMRVPSFDCDFRVGGAYRMVMVRPDGEEYVVKGTYREIVPPQRLVYTWMWEEDTPEQEHDTLVTVEFNARGEQTELVLTHENLRNAESRDNHNDGWNSMLNKFEAHFKS